MALNNYPFWVNNFDRVKNYKDEYPLVTKIFDHPVSFWYGDKGKKYTSHIDKGIQRLLNRAYPCLPVFVIYNMPNRDMGQHSKGGAKTREKYLEFIDTFCNGIGNASPIVIYEPDSLPHAEAMDNSERLWRAELMKKSLEIITSRTNALVYIDIGHSNWLDAKIAAHMISSVTNDKVRGFSVNVSNFRTTEESMNWALQICETRTDDYFVIDTSRNGNGPFGNYWCNPPGRALGESPTIDTGEEKCDAFLWVKIPGESDGKCNGGPRAGRFWPEYAENLIRNSDK